MISEFDRRGRNRPAAVIKLAVGTEADFFNFLASCGINDPSRPLGASLYLVPFPDNAGVNSFLLNLADRIESAGPGLLMELVETRMMAVGGSAEGIRCGDFLLSSPGGDAPGAREIVLSAGIGFGSGAHPSTRLAMSLLAGVMADSRPKTVLDAGCGSGILALAAARYGAGSVLAVEIDPRSGAEAGENVGLNHLEDIVRVKKCGVSEIDGIFDLVIANMTPAVLMSVGEKLAAMTGGDIVVSGIQSRQGGDISGVFRSRGLVESDRAEEAGWLACRFRPSSR